ncbi:aromatic acid exporter family protein (plasmid) [Priestia megaterium]|uniref:aromatic acid exporter family protein n=1 Tax=Priestia megaterium TaxID=1404 RepID=UPI0035BE56CA
MKYKIGLRTLKTGVAVSLAIMVAQFCHLNFFVSSAIITILCVQNSKKKSLRSAMARFIACMLAIPFSYAFFEGIAYAPLVIGLLLLFFIPLTVILKVNEGVVTSTVIILHIYSTERTTWEIILNEVGLIIIGIGAALLVNVYMPSVDKKLKAYQEKIEKDFKLILIEIVQYLRTNEKNWKESEIKDVLKLIKIAKGLAFRDIENHFGQIERYYLDYFSIREKQLEIIERLLTNLILIQPMLKQRYVIADFIEELSLCIHPGNTTQLFLNKLKVLKEEYKKMPMPKTWEAFETKAQLYQLTQEMEHYLLIKSSLKVG